MIKQSQDEKKETCFAKVSIHHYDGRKGYRLFFTPSVKHKYCKDKETVLENADYFYRKVFGRSKDYHLYKVDVSDDTCCFKIRYYGYPREKGVILIDKNNREITLSKEKHKVLHWR